MPPGAKTLPTPPAWKGESDLGSCLRSHLEGPKRTRRVSCVPAPPGAELSTDQLKIPRAHTLCDTRHYFQHGDGSACIVLTTPMVAKYHYPHFSDDTIKPPVKVTQFNAGVQPSPSAPRITLTRSRSWSQAWEPQLFYLAADPLEKST